MNLIVGSFYHLSRFHPPAVNTNWPIVCWRAVEHQTCKQNKLLFDLCRCNVRWFFSRIHCVTLKTFERIVSPVNCSFKCRLRELWNLSMRCGSRWTVHSLNSLRMERSFFYLLNMCTMKDSLRPIHLAESTKICGNILIHICSAQWILVTRW